MRLDPSYLHFISKEELRILVAIEIGMKNHEFVPLQLISSIGNLRNGETFKTIRKLLKVKLVVHVGTKNNGYKLTYLGYDYLALHTFMKRGIIKDVICKIGVGKESDIYKCEAVDGTHIVLKLTRLGRRSFKTIKNNREYIQNRTSFNWLYLSRLSSMRQFTFMQLLFEDGFPTPRPIDTNRHAIVMSLIDGDPLCHVKKIEEGCSVKEIFLKSLELVKKFASRGLIHGDFNEFNLLISGKGDLTVIDFPQCISSKHVNGEEYFDRDVECLFAFFDKMIKKCNREEIDGKVYMNPNDVGFDVSTVPMPVLSEIEVEKRLDLEVRAKGHFKLSEQKQYDQFLKEWNNAKQEEAKNENENENQENEGYESGDEFDPSELEETKTIPEEDQHKDVQEKDIQQKVSHKISFDENDEDMKDLITQLQQIDQMQEVKQKDVQQKVQAKEQDDEDSQQEENEENEDGIEMREQWKGLTAFQIRKILKEEKRKERDQKKKELSTEQYVKRALNRKPIVRTHISRGNYGAKAKVKENKLSIKEGIELGW